MHSFLSLLSFLGGYKCYRNGRRQKRSDIPRDQQIQRHTQGSILVFFTWYQSRLFTEPKANRQKKKKNQPYIRV